jgi:hypothetical protein
MTCLQEQLARLIGGGRTPTCDAGMIANLTPGTAVELLSDSPQCGAMAQVRVKTGKYQDKVGCLNRSQMQTTYGPQ